MTTFHTLPVIAVRPETDQAICLTLGVPPELGEQFRRQPGQYLTLRVDVD